MTKPNIPARILLNIGILLLIFNGMFPLFWMILTSFKPEAELVRLPITYLPQNPTFSNYIEVFRANPFHLFLRNSFIVSVGATIFCVFFAGLAGYALGRLRIPGKRMILTGIVMTSMFPALVLLVPLYRIFRGVEVVWLSNFFAFMEGLGLSFLPDVVMTPNILNTYWALIIPYVALSLPIATLILTSFFQLIPQDLESAALIDGCTRMGALYRVIAPVSAPGIVTAGIIVFVNSWNEFLLALTFNTSLNMRTVPVGITFYQGEFAFPWALISSAITIGVLPLVILIIFFQQRIISGLTAGGVKG